MLFLSLQSDRKRQSVNFYLYLEQIRFAFWKEVLYIKIQFEKNDLKKPRFKIFFPMKKKRKFSTPKRKNFKMTTILVTLN